MTKNGASVYWFAALVGLGGLLFGFDIGIISGILDMASFQVCVLEVGAAAWWLAGYKVL